MDSASPALASALLQWLNSFALPRPANSLRDLEDGQIIWHVLHDIDGTYFTGSLPEKIDRTTADNWIPRWQNLKHIDKMATTYLRDVCGELPNLSRNMNPDLKSVAINGSPEQTLKLLETVLFTAMFSPVSNDRMVQVMGTLDTKAQMTIAQAIQQAQELDSNMGSTGMSQEMGADADNSLDSEPSRGPSFDRDPEIEREERLIQAMQRNKQLDDRIARLTEEMEESHESNEKLQRRIATLEEDLDRRQQGVKNQNLDDFRSQTQSDRDLIAELESDLQFNKSKADDQERQIERLKADATTKQELRDEIQLLRAERDELQQKAKTSENLKKKIQILQDQERAASSLRSELQSASDQLQELETLRERNISLQKANEESAKAIANVEQTIFDQKTARQRQDYEFRMLHGENQQLKELNTRLMEQNREHEERIRDMEGSGHGDRMGSLEDELDETDRPPTENKRDSARVIRTSTSTNELLSRQRADALSARVKGLEEQYLNVFQDNLGLNYILKSGDDPKLQESSFYVRQREQLGAVSKELGDVKSKYIALTTENADLKHRVAAAETANSNANVEALKENAERQKHVEQIEQKVQELDGLLRHALSPDKMNVSGDLRESNDFKLIYRQLTAVQEAGPQEAAQIIDHTAARLADKQVRGWKENQDLSKRNQDQAAHIQSLQRELEQAKKAGGEATMSPAAQQELVNLRRENKLLTSAWYDLTSRLQSNTVVLQRRSEAPKSWLGRQRNAVGQGGSTRR